MNKNLWMEYSVCSQYVKRSICIAPQYERFKNTVLHENWPPVVLEITLLGGANLKEPASNPTPQKNADSAY